MEDLEPLTKLWAAMQFPVEDLAKRVTDFQVVEAEQGEIVGAIALEIVQRQGRIHSEAFTDFSLAEHARPHLWNRIESLAQNHGLVRLWTQEQAPFWSRSGLTSADTAQAAELPARWKDLPGRWLTLKLRESLDAILAADKEFALFMQAEKARTNRTIRKARVLKVLATLVALAVAAAAIVAAVYVLRQSPMFRG